MKIGSTVKHTPLLAGFGNLFTENEEDNDDYK